MKAAGLGPIVRDGEWTLVEYDPATERSVWQMVDGDKVIFRVDTPVHKTLEENTYFRNSAEPGWKGDYHRIASVPMQLLYDENLGLNKAILNGDDKYISRWLNDSDNRAFRTREGNV